MLDWDVFKSIRQVDTVRERSCPQCNGTLEEWEVTMNLSGKEGVKGYGLFCDTPWCRFATCFVPLSFGHLLALSPSKIKRLPYQVFVNHEEDAWDDSLNFLITQKRLV